MEVTVLTESEKDQLNGEKWNETTFFYPTKDNDDVWILSPREANNGKTEFSWLKHLPKKTHNPKTTTP